MTKKRPGYNVLLVLAILATLAAVLTLVPSSSAIKVSFLGYKAICPLAPISTGICLLMALTACVLRARIFVEK